MYYKCISNWLYYKDNSDVFFFFVWDFFHEICAVARIALRFESWTTSHDVSLTRTNPAGGKKKLCRAFDKLKDDCTALTLYAQTNIRGNAPSRERHSLPRVRLFINSTTAQGLELIPFYLRAVTTEGKTALPAFQNSLAFHLEWHYAVPWLNIPLTTQSHLTHTETLKVKRQQRITPASSPNGQFRIFLDWWGNFI